MQIRTRRLVCALGLYAVWTVATWLFEGRIRTLLRPEATGDRIVYAFVVNLLLGVGLTVALVRAWVRSGALDAGRCGWRLGPRCALAAAAGLALGGLAYIAQGAPSRHPVVVANAYAQVFVVSAAEVAVCWGAVGIAVEAAFGRRSLLATGVAMLVASALFGLYHFAHSPPFDTWPMVGLLSVVGLATGAFFFVSRDLLGTALFHNFLGTFGVVQALAGAGAVATLEQWQPPLLFTAALTLAVLAAGYALVGRAGTPPAG
jgi:hypothetical protein